MNALFERPALSAGLFYSINQVALTTRRKKQNNYCLILSIKQPDIDLQKSKKYRDY